MIKLDELKNQITETTDIHDFFKICSEDTDFHQSFIKFRYYIKWYSIFRAIDNSKTTSTIFSAITPFSAITIIWGSACTRTK